ncbi:Histone acetyltransferase HAC2 [Frankliniella fusca]|uniref:Histone acetyltransferase HAC2 n=1 Tax=Frankliniella fusca TaxID=407009 RepID=A0AAE1GXU6_9NEOP|nr:Histone acetyltransferase HAC2 [Frankliniella fusca]KAK3917154.1 Histone acetyltransferase HAC2 [Frankliniella fusca]KAK3921432.1 Histone acetyltransferase HAC2 [Frankliniella fusca]KAK3929419.1 Histone acetyltransferase HAC2 [Frankliniella fusca]
MWRYKEYLVKKNVPVPRTTEWRRKRRARLQESARQQRLRQEEQQVTARVIEATSADAPASPEVASSTPTISNVEVTPQVPLPSQDSVSNPPKSFEKSFKVHVDEQFKDCLCPCTDVTSNDLTLMVIAIGMRHKLTWLAQLDILKTVASIFPNRSDIPFTKHHLFKRVQLDKVDVNHHIYCKDCRRYLADKSDVKEQICDICEKTLDVNAAANYFCSFSLADQCRDLFQGPENLGEMILNHRVNHQKKVDTLEDICDGSEYLKYCTPDGVPVGKSGKSIWPIYISINELPEEIRHKFILLAGLYIGPKDPNINEFMTPFIKEANKLSCEGFEWYHKKISRSVISKAVPMCGIVDSVARAMLMNMQSFHAYAGCTFCYKIQEPTSNNKNLKFVVHLGEVLEDRTMETMQADIKEAYIKIQNAKEVNHCKGVKGPSCLMDLKNFDLCRGVVVDYMHCVLLGCCRLHMKLLFHTNFKHCWNISGDPSKVSMEDIISSVDERLLKIKPPKSITRTPQSLGNLGAWKASEWRSWILFYCVVCLEGLLANKYLKHIAMLSSAVNILLQKSVTISEIGSAHELLMYYQVYFQEYFGKHNMVYNIHLLSHVCKGVLRFGPLWTHSAFPYEGQNRYLLQMCTSPFSVVKQVSTRYLLNKSFPQLCVSLSGGDRSIDLCEDILERRLKCYVYNADCVLVGKGSRAALNEEEISCIQDFVGYDHNVIIKSLAFKSMLVRGFRVSVSGSDSTRNLNCYVDVKDVGVCCVTKIINYLSTEVLVLVKPVFVTGEATVKQIIDGVDLGHIQKVGKVPFGSLMCVSPKNIISQFVFMDLVSKQFVCRLPYGCYKD